MLYRRESSRSYFFGSPPFVSPFSFFLVANEMESTLSMNFVTLFPLLLLLCQLSTAKCFKHENISFPSFQVWDEGNFKFSSTDTTTIDGGALQLTPDSANEGLINLHYNKSGRIMYSKPFRLFEDAANGDDDILVPSFNSTFVINLSKILGRISGHGLAFVIAPNTSLPESSYGQWLGLTNGSTDGNRENHFVAIEFDTVKQEFDPDGNHVGLNINSVKSEKKVSLNDSNIDLQSGLSYSVWVQYNGTSKLMQVFMDLENASKPSRPILNETINLKEHLKPKSYFGFSASTGDPHIQLNCVRSWTLEVEVIPKKKDWKWLIITAAVGIPVLTVLSFLCAIIFVKKRRSRSRKRIEEQHELRKFKWLPGMPREFKYKELKKATNNFHESMKLGEGGFGIVYKGILQDKGHHNSSSEIAVKKFSRDSIKGKGDFLAELAIIHRLRHKHLVRLVGWCHENGKLLLAYDFMPNGSLEKYLYGESEQITLNWNHRYKILAGVASALYYLQNEYDQKVVHRDLKASNILLDSDFNARLGDFGLARAIENEKNSYTELGLAGVPGTRGYVAPECFHTGKATPESDVFGFGAVVLEVVSGRSPGIMIPHEQLSYTLVDWVWMLHRDGRIEDAVDQRLNNDIVVDEAKRLLLLGLACSHPIASERPKTDDILQIVSGTSPVPHVPPFKPVFSWPSAGPPSSMFDMIFSSMTTSSHGSSVTSNVSKSKTASDHLPV